MNKRLVSGLAALALVFSGAEALPGDAFAGFGIIASAADIVANGACGENLTWTLDSEGTLTISGTGAMYDYAEYENDRTGLPISPWQSSKDVKKAVITGGVTSIGNSAFVDCPNLTSITFPNTITSIGSNAFTGCMGIKGITIPNSVTHIGKSAFSSCWKLAAVIIPNGVTRIEEDLFRGCLSLNTIVIPKSVTSFGGMAFELTGWLEKKQKLDPLVIVNNVVVNGEKLVGDVEVPDGVTSVADFAFFLSDGLTGVTLPESVTSIGECAFAECEKLERVNIPGNITGIEDNTFVGCRSLKDITIPDGVTSIGSQAFLACTSMKNVTVPAGVKVIGKKAFGYASSMENDRISGFTLTGQSGSAAEQYATDNGFTFVSLGDAPVTYGDLDGKDGVTDADVALLQQYLADWKVTIDEKAADVNCDGKVDEADIALMQQFLADWKVTLGAKKA